MYAVETKSAPVKMETLLQNAMKNYVAEVDACFRKMTADHAAKKVGSWADRASVGSLPTWEDAVRVVSESRASPHSWLEYEKEGTWTCDAVAAEMQEMALDWRVEEAWRHADAAASRFVKECRIERLRRGWRDGDDYKYGRD